MLPEIIIAAIPGQSKSVVSLKKNKKKKKTQIWTQEWSLSH